MEGAILSTQNNNRFRTHLKNAASALCARTLPKQRRAEATGGSRHHTYPRSTQPKRVAIPCRMEVPLCGQLPAIAIDVAPDNAIDMHTLDKINHNDVIKLKGSLAREVQTAWGYRVGSPDQPAPADRVQSLFNDIELYPTKTQVFEMLVCARQCAGRKSLVLTFGEFCVFAAELRRCSRQARQTQNKPESPQWNVDKEFRDKDSICKPLNGSEASPPPCEVFLGGSCNPTTWRSDIAIPILKKMGITYFNPQVEVWSTELIEVEHRAKAAARALLFVLDSETRTVAASVEAAHLAAAPRDLLLVLRPYQRHQRLAHETITDLEYVELSRARATLQEAVERRGLPAFTDIPALLALRDITRAPQPVLERLLPSAADAVDFETFCAAVAELASDTGNSRACSEVAEEARTEGAAAARDGGGLRVYNDRLRAYGRKLRLFIPKNGSSFRGAETNESGSGATGGSGGSSGDSVFTPGTERRLERLPAMLGAPTHDVYLGGSFPCECERPEEVLRREGLTYVVPRANDYTRMFSAPGRRSAPHAEAPHRDKKPRPDPDPDPSPDRDLDLDLDPAVQLRATDRAPADRLSASDFYKVTEDITPQPFKGTYDEDLLLGSRVLVFSMCAEAACFSTMVLAAHYMGLRPAATVLLVQPMDPAAAHPYSEAAVKDYNRGRHYLTDLARRSSVPVFDNAKDALSCVISRLRPAL